MADDVTLPGTGDVVAADDISGKKHQRVKIQHGADGSATDVSSASPLPVSDAGGSLTVDDGGSTVSIDDGGGSLTVDGTVGVSGTVPVSDGSGSLTVDAPLGTPVATRLSDGASAIGSTAQRLHVDDGGSSLSVDDNGGSLTVDVGTALPAGSNAIGKLAANSGVDIGDVDVTSLPALPAGSNNIGQVDPRGNVAHDAADSGNPVKVGRRARTTALPAAVAADDRTDAISDKFGRGLSIAAPLDTLVEGTLNRTNNTGADVIAAPGASIAIVVTNIEVSNGHASVGTKVSIRSGTTVKRTMYCAAAGGGWTAENEKGLFVCAANEAVTAICGTTGADVDINVSGYKIPA